MQLKYTLKHWKSSFSYSPLVLWWPPLSHFQEKGIFSWPFLGFHTYFKIPIEAVAAGSPYRYPLWLARALNSAIYDVKWDYEGYRTTARKLFFILK